MTAALEGGEWSAARPARTLPPGKDPVPILQEAGWAPGPVWTGGKSRRHRDTIPDRPTRSQSLYQLSYLHYMKSPNIMLRPRRECQKSPPKIFIYVPTDKVLAACRYGIWIFSSKFSVKWTQVASRLGVFAKDVCGLSVIYWTKRYCFYFTLLRVQDALQFKVHSTFKNMRFSVGKNRFASKYISLP